MKRLSKLLSIILVFALCFGLSSTAFALSLEPAPTVVSSTDTVLEEIVDCVAIVRSEDLSNGDARVTLFKDGAVESISYLDRSSSKIFYSKYENDYLVTQSEKSINVQPPISQMSEPNVFVNVGKVRYNHYVQDSLGAITSIDWSYNTQLTLSDTYNLNGHYEDITVAISFIISLFFISATTASAIFLTILSNLDKVQSTADYIIPDYYVSCNTLTVTWRALAANKEKRIIGYRYDITHEGFEGEVEYGGDYYPTTAIHDHDTSLALTYYGYFFKGYNRVTIHSWPY